MLPNKMARRGKDNDHTESDQICRPVMGTTPDPNVMMIFHCNAVWYQTRFTLKRKMLPLPLPVFFL